MNIVEGFWADLDVAAIIALGVAIMVGSALWALRRSERRAGRVNPAIRQ